MTIRKRRGLAIVVLLCVGLWAGCTKQKPRVAQTPRAPQRVSPRVTPGDEFVEETGIASWYGHPYHGRASASGEIYDMEQMTAAHRTLAFGTVVKVEDLDNGLVTTVRINDRGPFVEGRVIDLSRAAAREIQMLGPGTARVRLTIETAPARPEPALFGVQVAAFANQENAIRMEARMRDAYGSSRMVFRAGANVPWRVTVGRVATTIEAEELAQRVRQEQHSPEAFVVRLDPVPIPESH